MPSTENNNILFVHIGQKRVSSIKILEAIHGVRIRSKTLYFLSLQCIRKPLWRRKAEPRSSDARTDVASIDRYASSNSLQDQWPHRLQFSKPIAPHQASKFQNTTITTERFTIIKLINGPERYPNQNPVQIYCFHETDYNRSFLKFKSIAFFKPFPILAYQIARFNIKRITITLPLGVIKTTLITNHLNYKFIESPINKQTFNTGITRHLCLAILKTS